LRASHDLTTWAPPGDERHQFHERLHQLYLAMGLAIEEVASDAAAPSAVRREMRADVAAFARGPWEQPDCQRLANRISATLDDLTVWLAEPAVAPTINAAEWALLPAVVTRKTSFGSRSKGGAHAFAGLLSLIETWKRQGRDCFDTAYPILVPSHR
jgi:hypothetical protein